MPNNVNTPENTTQSKTDSPTHSEVTVESEAPAVVPESPSSSEADVEGVGAEAHSELANLQADLEKFRDLALRTQADFENFRKRSAREREEAIRYANADFIIDLLPIVDNFELGMVAAGNDPASSAILEGFKMVQKQLNDFLRTKGVEPVDAEPGEVFNPNIHEALGQENSDTVAEGHVIRQIRRGWKLKDRLLRPATVFVSRGMDKEASSSGE